MVYSIAKESRKGKNSNNYSSKGIKSSKESIVC